MQTTTEHDKWMISINDKLFQAIKDNNFWMVHVLLESGANLSISNAEGLNPIEYADKLGRKKMVAFLKSKEEAE